MIDHLFPFLFFLFRMKAEFFFTVFQRFSGTLSSDGTAKSCPWSLTIGQRSSTQLVIVGYSVPFGLWFSKS